LGGNGSEGERLGRGKIGKNVQNMTKNR